MDQPTIFPPAMLEPHTNGNGTAELIREAIDAVETAPVKPLARPKRKAINVTLSNGYVQVVHAPGFQDMPVYFRAMPALDKLGKFLEYFFVPDGVDENGKNKVKFVLPEVVPSFDPDDMQLLAPLGAVMCDISVDEFNDMETMDGLMLLLAINQLQPKNSSADQGS